MSKPEDVLVSALERIRSDYRMDDDALDRVIDEALTAYRSERAARANDPGSPLDAEELLAAENARLRAALVAILAELRTTNTSTESIVKDIAKRSVLDGCAVPNRAVDYFRDIIREAEITATSDPALAGQGLSAIISRCDEAIAALKGADAAPDHGPQRGRR